ncbi:PAS domain-containing protein [Natronomonas salina]|uniref:histidine kinase N-terminal 7TM domain-containing protein n=1 Tax=Natronomonas salina TaxID=1710540 RepID=UPI0015B68323|nr:histidine kinase N-terminal 7TM domain-containing protein [Natronomonas salina]QLD88582.1 PAS domain-containing protein [Natronomonas salina]
MEYQLSVYLVPLVLAAAISAVLAGFVFANRRKRTAMGILGILVAAVVWSATDAMRLASVDLSAKLLWHNLRFVGSTLVVFSVFFHALAYTNREKWITARTMALVGSVFAVTIALAWTESLLGHGLIRADRELVEVGTLVLVEFEYGPWFYVNAAYSYLLLVVTAGLYLVEFVRRTGTYRLQAGGLLLGTLVPWGMNGVYLAGFSPVDLTGFGFTVTGVVFVAQLYRFELLDVVPIARSTVVNHIENGYLVVDTEDRVLDVNEAGSELLDRPREEIIGATIDSLFVEYPKVTEKFGGETDVRDDVTLYQDGERRDYDVEISPVYDDHDRHIGRVVLIRDVTEQRRRQRTLQKRTAALERQNERLDQFAGVVSHDLRNPVAVAKGHLEIARTDGDPNSFDRVEEALDRVEEITNDVLALARQDQEAVECERVELAVVAEQAWKTVDTGDASLTVEASRSLSADPGRLRRALENLFRNSIEHGPADVSVRVGGADGGFYVADDGPGIPAADRDDVFDPGYTTDDRGTGFGLAIVEGTAEAHGWSVVATEGSDGGARFEFTGVEDAADGDPATDGALP